REDARGRAERARRALPRAQPPPPGAAPRLRGLAMSEPAAPRKVTVVTPVLNEAANLPAYEQAARDLFFTRTDVAITVLFVDDGSTAASWSVIQEMSAREPRFRGLRLSRNFGPHAALSCGIHHATDADALAVLAADLQDPPETVLQFIETWQKGARI